MFEQQPLQTRNARQQFSSSAQWLCSIPSPLSESSAFHGLMLLLMYMLSSTSLRRRVQGVSTFSCSRMLCSSRDSSAASLLMLGVVVLLSVMQYVLYTCCISPSPGAWQAAYVLHVLD